MKLFVILFLFFSFAIFGQPGDSLARKTSWGLSFSPDLSYRTLKYGSSAQWIADKRNKEELPNFGFTCGLMISRKISKKISLDFGLLFSDKGQKTKWKNLEWTSSQKDYPAASRTIFHYRYLQIPLKMNYYFRYKIYDLFFSGGISSNLFLSQRTILQVKNSNSDNTNLKSTEPGIYSRMNFEMLVGAGISIPLAKRLNLRIEPTFRRSLIPVLLNVPDKEYLFSLGLNAGLYLRFKDKSSRF